MDCKLCDPDTEDWNVCENCTHSLYPLTNYMDCITGDTGWNDFDAVLYPCDKDHIPIIRAFFCGMQACFNVTDEGMIICTDKPIYRIMTMQELHL